MGLFWGMGFACQANAKQIMCGLRAGASPKRNVINKFGTEFVRLHVTRRSIMILFQSNACHNASICTKTRCVIRNVQRITISIRIIAVSSAVFNTLTDYIVRRVVKSTIKE